MGPLAGYVLDKGNVAVHRMRFREEIPKIDTTQISPNEVRRMRRRVMRSFSFL